ncbi:MAG: monovalent cation/H+ antiporter subunit D family protein [Pseudomonadota bacterium]
MTPATNILLALATPLIGAVLIVAAHRVPNVRESVTMVTASVLFLLVASLTPLVLAGERPEVTLLEMMPGLSLKFKVEPLGMLFGLIASGLWIVNSLYSIGYMRANDEQHQTRFYVCFAGALASAIGIAFAGNLLTLFVFYEALTLITYPLVTHAGTEDAKRAGRVYLGLLVGTSIGFLLVAMVWIWHLTGTVDFQPGGILLGKAGNATVGVLLALCVFGIGKAALMPFHRWLPAAMVAPTPVSALLHAVAVVKAGVFSVLKVIIYIFGVGEIAGLKSVDWLPFFAGFTIIVASVIALRSDNLKRRLAYSTVSQLSYVVLAAALLTPLSIVGAALHIATHAVGKITLFFAAGAIYTAAHKTEVSQLNGIGRRMPWTMGAFTVGALSLIGIPPAAGFVSKWFIISGAIDGGHYLALGVLIASTLLNAAYFLPIVHAAFFRAPDAGGHEHGEAPWPMVVALSITAAMTIALFFFADLPLRLVSQLVGMRYGQ